MGRNIILINFYNINNKSLRMRPFDSISHSLAFSQARSSPLREPFADATHSLPPISSPLLTNYRTPRAHN